VRQSKVLEAEGERLAIILNAQGEAQKLRILSVGATTLDSKALTVLSLDTMKGIGASPSTKWILPFEVTKVLDGVSEYLGSAKSVPEREISKMGDVEQYVGKAEDILGPIPTPEELRADLKALEVTMREDEKVAQQVRDNTKTRMAPPPQ
jgi:hypothetical protein